MVGNWFRKIILKIHTTILAHNFSAKFWYFSLRFIQRHYLSAKLWRSLNYFFLDLRSRKQGLAILDYQMGRVGSSTIRKSLEAFNIPVYQIHLLSPKKSDKVKRWRKIVNITFETEANWLAKRLERQRKRGTDPRKRKIVSLVRDPVARNVSAFFRDLFAGHLNLKNPKVTGLRDFFIRWYPHEIPLTWFDVELKKYFGIDVYAEDFPKSKGYKIYKNSNLLVLKLEKLNECVQTAFREFLGLDNFKLKNDNIAKGKIYYPVYQEFLSVKILPPSYVEKMYNSKFARQFYTEEELEAFTNKWT